MSKMLEMPLKEANSHAASIRAQIRDPWISVQKSRTKVVRNCFCTISDEKAATSAKKGKKGHSQLRQAMAGEPCQVTGGAKRKYASRAHSHR